MSEAARDPRRVGESPLPTESGSPRWSAEATLRLESRDLVREVRLMAEGKFFGLPLSQAHARAAVSHIDQLIEDVEVRDALISALLADVVSARRAATVLERRGES